MTENVKVTLDFLRSGEHKKTRGENPHPDLTGKASLKDPFSRVLLFENRIKCETPNIFEHDIFGFNRRNKNLSFITDDQGRAIKGGGGNNTPNYARVIGMGFEGVRDELERSREKLGAEYSDFFDAMHRYIDSVYDISDRYRAEAERIGNSRLASALLKIPRQPADSFYEACLFFKIITYTLRFAHCVHMTLGRFDQYMYPYYKRDLERGISREEIFETLELFFIALNYDGDLYPGVQLGDNGQSMMLGGYDKDGNDMYNELSDLCMRASLELSLIDPKINLRVNKTTTDERYEFATKLTKQGLGFPQYCNDDIVIPFLLSFGYDEEDAYNYTVAACWEHIIPHCAADTPNKATMDFPSAVNRAIHAKLAECESFDELLDAAKLEIAKACDDIVERCTPKYSNRPQGAPKNRMVNYLSMYIDGCIEKGLDYTEGGAKYNNFGSHGAGISSAADALAAVKQVVFEEKSVTPDTLLAARDAAFVGYSELRNKLLSCPKMGNNIDSVDNIACELMGAFCDNLNNRPSGYFNGVWRAGTGSAMEYILTAKKCPATADGRNAKQPYGCSFSPAITTRLDGPLSVIASFTKFDMKRIANGGPVTMELHDTVFRNEEGEKKIAQLVKAFVHMGGHQLQLNAINRDRLLDAKAHPENHPNLIVRVWGWSGYFCELDPEYQNHVISRTEFTV